jgi:hypothetical protein
MTDCPHHYELDPVVDFSLHWTCRDCGEGYVTGCAPALTIAAVAEQLTADTPWTFTADPSAAARRAAEAEADFFRRYPKVAAALEVLRS